MGGDDWLPGEKFEMPRGIETMIIKATDRGYFGHACNPQQIEEMKTVQANALKAALQHQPNLNRGQSVQEQNAEEAFGCSDCWSP